MRERTLFVHVPKTGGTTLDCIFADHYYKYPMIRGLVHSSPVSRFHGVNNSENIYVSGHFPVGVADLDRFSDKITIIRNPFDVICSVIAFGIKYGISIPRLHSALQGGEYEIYSEYYSPAFDFDRFLIDAGYGISSGYFDYTGIVQVSGLLGVIDKFDRVIDFDNIGVAIKQIIIEKGMFPYSDIPRKRSYGYRPDYESAQSVLSKFDSHFFDLVRDRFMIVSPDIDGHYECIQGTLLHR